MYRNIILTQLSGIYIKFTITQIIFIKRVDKIRKMEYNVRNKRE